MERRGINPEIVKHLSVRVKNILGIVRGFVQTKSWVHLALQMYLFERARCLLLYVGVSESFWVEASNMTCYVINRSPHASLERKVTYEV